MPKKKPEGPQTIPVELIERRVFVIRGRQMVLDQDLAAIYQVKPNALRETIKRNSNRLPSDCVIQLFKEEAEALVSQNVIPSRRSLGGFLPDAFTEQGVAMLSSIVRNQLAPVEKKYGQRLKVVVRYVDLT